MKIANLTFSIMLTAILFIGGNAQETVSKPLKLSLQIKDVAQLCVGKPFTISARLENVSNTEQLLDERKLWRSYFSWGTIESKDKKDKNKSEDFSYILSNLTRIKSGMSLVKRENWNLIRLKPGGFYEDRIVFTANDNFFEEPGTYTYTVNYLQPSEKPLNDNSSSESLVSNPDELELLLKDCN